MKSTDGGLTWDADLPGLNVPGSISSEYASRNEYGVQALLAGSGTGPALLVAAPHTGLWRLERGSGEFAPCSSGLLLPDAITVAVAGGGQTPRILVGLDGRWGVTKGIRLGTVSSGQWNWQTPAGLPEELKPSSHIVADASDPARLAALLDRALYRSSDSGLT